MLTPPAAPSLAGPADPAAPTRPPAARRRGPASAPGPHLIRRPEGLVWRRRVPRRCAHAFSRNVLVISLGPLAPREGRRKAAEATRFADAAFALVEACGCGMLDGGTVDRIVVNLMRFELEAREALRAIAPPRGPQAIELAMRIEAATRQTLVSALAHNDYTDVTEPVNAALARLGVDLDEDAPDWRQVARRAAMGLIAVSEENTRRESGVYGEDAPLLAAALAQPDAAPAPAQAAAPAPLMDPTPPTPAPAAIPPAPAPTPAETGAAAPEPERPASGAPAQAAEEDKTPAARVAAAKTKGASPRRAEAKVGATSGFNYRTPPPPNPAAPNGSMKFFDLGMAYVEARCAESKSWTANSAPGVRSALRAFKALEGNLTCDECDEARFREFFDTYRRLPATWGKGGRTPFEDIDYADAKTAALADELAAMKERGASLTLPPICPRS